jgi:hypothetical protein
MMRRREPARGLEHPGDVVVVLGAIVQFELHDRAQLGGLGAVHRQHQRLFQKRFLDLLQVVVERYDSGLPRLLRVADHLFQHQPRVLARFKEHARQAAESLQHDRKGKLKHHGAERATEDDQRRRRLQNLPDFPALEHQAEQNPAECYEDAAEAALVHALAPRQDFLFSARESSRTAPAPDSLGDKEVSKTIPGPARR